jgi:molybdopterin molybdotransferase
MIRFEEAVEKILDAVKPMPAVSSRVSTISGKVIAEPVMARLDLPPFDNSAVDGFGIRLTDVATASDGSPVSLKLVGTVRAGDSTNVRIAAGTALKILTGALVPPGVDAVIMREYTCEENGHVVIKRGAQPGENIRRRGGEFLRGQDILPAGLVATPAVVGLLANLGYSAFSVFKRPRAAIITTGDELTKPGRALMPGKIYDSNSYAMESALRSAGIEDTLILRAGENYSATKKAFLRALNFADIIISTGGVSVGDYDYVKPVLEDLGVETALWRIAMKPGKPVYFGTYYDKAHRRNKYIFGLPGNPVSALITYHQLVKPALAKLMGLTSYQKRRTFMAQLLGDLRKKAGRLEFVRAKLEYGENGALHVRPSAGQDSHMLGGLAIADVVIHFPLEAEKLSDGSPVLVEPLVWQVGN